MSKLWWKAAGIRALKTVCQTAIAMIGTTALMQDVNWLAVLSASALSGVLSLLTSLAGLPEVEMQEEQLSHEMLISDPAPVEIEHGPDGTEIPKQEQIEGEG